MAKQKKESEKKAKPLTASKILQRVRGCGEAEADALVTSLKLSDEALQAAYDKGGAAVSSLLDEAYDKANPPPKKPKPEQEQESTPTV